jgi:signal peptidase II
MVVAVVLDQVTKYLATRMLAEGPLDLGIVGLRLVANRGALMGIPAPTALIVLGAAAGLMVALRGFGGASLSASVGYGLIAGGALGNLVDRFIERGSFPPNAVVDWIGYGHITFNPADALILAGLLLVMAKTAARQSTLEGSTRPTTTVSPTESSSPGVAKVAQRRGS